MNQAYESYFIINDQSTEIWHGNKLRIKAIYRSKTYFGSYPLYGLIKIATNNKLAITYKCQNCGKILSSASHVLQGDYLSGQTRSHR